MYIVIYIIAVNCDSFVGSFIMADKIRYSDYK